MLTPSQGPRFSRMPHAHGRYTSSCLACRDTALGCLKLLEHGGGGGGGAVWGLLANCWHKNAPITKAPEESFEQPVPCCASRDRHRGQSRGARHLAQRCKRYQKSASFGPCRQPPLAAPTPYGQFPKHSGDMPQASFSTGPFIVTPQNRYPSFLGAGWVPQILWAALK